jgi:uncharacterized protein (TIRG00374 family)
MKRRFTRWLLPTLRYGLCAAAIVYLVTVVSWNDHVRLNDPAQTRVRLLEMDEEQGTLTIERDGQPEIITWEQVYYDGDVPDISYGISDVVRRMDFRKGLLAILIFLPVPILQSIRLVWMLAVQNVPLSYWNAFKLSYAGNFFNFALPGFFGGDLIKAYYVSRFTHRKTEAVTTIFLDRLVGLSGLMMLATVTFLLAWNRPEWDPRYRATLATGLGLIWGGLCLGCMFLFSHRLRHLIKLPQLAERLPAAEQIIRIGRATVSMRQHKTLVVMSLANTLVLQLFVVVAAYTMSQALGMQGHFTLYFIFVPIGFLIAAIPISPPNAAGVMEAAYVQFFTVGGLNAASAAVAFALANRLTQLVWALPGVLVPLLGAHLPSQAELKELEELEAEPEPDEAPDATGDDDGISTAESASPATGK